MKSILLSISAAIGTSVLGVVTTQIQNLIASNEKSAKTLADLETVINRKFDLQEARFEGFYNKITLHIDNINTQTRQTLSYFTNTSVSSIQSMLSLFLMCFGIITVLYISYLGYNGDLEVLYQKLLAKHTMDSAAINSKSIANVFETISKRHHDALVGVNTKAPNILSLYQNDLKLINFLSQTFSKMEVHSDGMSKTLTENSSLLKIIADNMASSIKSSALHKSMPSCPSSSNNGSGVDMSKLFKK
jgi:hypothetical protein